jgi:hypothetical protein
MIFHLTSPNLPYKLFIFKSSVRLLLHGTFWFVACLNIQRNTPNVWSRSAYFPWLQCLVWYGLSPKALLRVRNRSFNVLYSSSHEPPCWLSTIHPILSQAYLFLAFLSVLLRVRPFMRFPEDTPIVTDDEFKCSTGLALLAVNVCRFYWILPMLMLK